MSLISGIIRQVHISTHLCIEGNISINVHRTKGTVVHLFQKESIWHGAPRLANCNGIGSSDIPQR